jgi:hypothetical protein
MDLSTVASELYGLPPGEFVSVRDAKATEARRAGDRELAQAIKQLRRPTTGAWLTNLLVRERRDRVNELLDLGDDMRRAQSDLDGDDLRRLSKLRSQLVAALGGEAERIARAHGHVMNAPILHEIEATLEAAVADRAAGEALVSGNLTISLQYSGFGSVDLTGVVAAPASPSARTRAPKKAERVPRNVVQSVADRRRQKKIEDAEGLLCGAQDAEVTAEEAVAQAEGSLDAARRARALLEQRMSELEQQLREVRGDHDKAKRTERDAQKGRDIAQRNLLRARDRLAGVTADIEDLRSTGG